MLCRRHAVDGWFIVAARCHGDLAFEEICREFFPCATSTMKEDDCMGIRFRGMDDIRLRILNRGAGHGDQV